MQSYFEGQKLPINSVSLALQLNCLEQCLAPRKQSMLSFHIKSLIPPLRLVGVLGQTEKNDVLGKAKEKNYVNL